MEQKIYKTSPKVVIEYFADGALALRMSDLNFFELNSSSSEVLKHTDGVRNITQVASIITNLFDITQSQAVQDVHDMYEYCYQKQLVERITQE